MIFVMTTNHIEMLDEALIRPGRINLNIYTHNCSREQIKRIAKEYYPK